MNQSRNKESITPFQQMISSGTGAIMTSLFGNNFFFWLGFGLFDCAIHNIHCIFLMLISYFNLNTPSDTVGRSKNQITSATKNLFKA